LHALAKVKSRGVKFTYRLGGDGPERIHLQKLARQLGLGENIIFGQGLSGDAYRQELIKTDIYLLPSLRDNSPRTLMEAMLAGCVPIVADCGGPGEIVTEECGCRIALENPKTMADEIADAILKLHLDRAWMQSKSTAAHRRIATGYSEQSYLQSIEGIYREALKSWGANNLEGSR
jgi:glycosyltransferase involved in cell wall biosynthesis